MKIKTSAQRGLGGFAILVVAAILGVAMAQMEEGVNVSFALPESSVTLNEPIFVDFSIHNGLTESIRFDLGKDLKTNFDFMITHPDGSKVQAPRLPTGGIGQIGKRSLVPKTTYTQRLLLNEWYQINAPGEYTIEAKLTGQIETASGKAVTPQVSGSIHLKIHTRNPDKLKKICEDLVRTTIESLTVADAIKAALILSYVQDPVAVPYLEQVLKQAKWGKREAITGLGRIHNEEAIKILTAVAEGENEELKSAARAALSRLDSQPID